MWEKLFISSMCGLGCLQLDSQDNVEIWFLSFISLGHCWNTSVPFFYTLQRVRQTTHLMVGEKNIAWKYYTT